MVIAYLNWASPFHPRRHLQQLNTGKNLFNRSTRQAFFLHALDYEHDFEEECVVLDFPQPHHYKFACMIFHLFAFWKSRVMSSIENLSLRSHFFFLYIHSLVSPFWYVAMDGTLSTSKSRSFSWREQTTGKDLTDLPRARGWALLVREWGANRMAFVFILGLGAFFVNVSKNVAVIDSMRTSVQKAKVACPIL